MERNLDDWKDESVRLIIKETGDDPLTALRQKARTLISQAYDLGWSGPPFNPFSLAELLNIDVCPDQDILDARIRSVSGEKLIIEYNPYQKPSRVNFSIAHEIGHALFPDCRSSIRNREKGKFGSSQWELEFLCNVAASEILLPYAFFGPEANSVPLGLDSVTELANRYCASLEAVLLRFTEVIEKRFAMVIASFSKPKVGVLTVDYSKNSRSFDLFIPRGYIIPSTSKAYECQNPGWTSYANEKWGIFNDMEYTIQAIGLSPLPNHGTRRVGLLVIPALASAIDENVEYRFGDATQPMGEGAKIIAQVVNTNAGTGFGFGRAMAKRWPESVARLKRWKSDTQNFTLGKSQLVRLVDDVYVYQMLAQKGFKPHKGKIPLQYEALRSCLISLAKQAKELNASVHMPRIGAGEAGGKWDIIEGMIFEELVNNKLKVTVYDLPGRRPVRRP